MSVKPPGGDSGFKLNPFRKKEKAPSAEQKYNEVMGEVMQVSANIASMKAVQNPLRKEIADGFTTQLKTIREKASALSGVDGKQLAILNDKIDSLSRTVLGETGKAAGKPTNSAITLQNKMMALSAEVRQLGQAGGTLSREEVRTHLNEFEREIQNLSDSPEKARLTGDIQKLKHKMSHTPPPLPPRT